MHAHTDGISLTLASMVPFVDVDPVRQASTAGQVYVDIVQTNMESLQAAIEIIVGTTQSVSG